MLTYILFIVGFVFLIKGADLLVNGASSIARRFGVSELVIGLTIVAFGTSAPELFVNLFSAFKGTTDIAIGNIVGSNIANIMLILGLSAVIYPLTVTKGTVWKEIPLSMLAMILVIIMANDVWVDSLGFSQLTRSDGLALVSFFIIFLYYTFGIAKVQGGDSSLNDTGKNDGFAKSLGMIVLGLIGLVLGGQWIVGGAIEIAKSFGLSEALIGLTIVAIGTSLPELATSVVAAYRKKSDIAIGNVVGSNIFNVFWILGLTAVIKPLPFAPSLNFDLAVGLLASILLFFWMFIGKKHQLERWQGLLLVFLYIAYLCIAIVRG